MSAFFEEIKRRKVYRVAVEKSHTQVPGHGRRNILLLSCDHPRFAELLRKYSGPA